MIGAGRSAKSFEPRILRIAVEVDQDIDPVLDDPARGLVIAEIGDVDPVIDGACRIRALVSSLGPDAAVIGEDLDLVAVVELEHLAGQEADGMLAQIGGDIADARPARRGKQRCRPAADGGDRRACRHRACCTGRRCRAGTADHRRSRPATAGRSSPSAAGRVTLAQGVITGHLHWPWRRKIQCWIGSR